MNEENLEYLLGSFKGRTSQRKLRLFAVACARTVMQWFPDESCRKAIEVAERFADRRITSERLRHAHSAAAGTLNAAWRVATRMGRNGEVHFSTKEGALACDSLSIAQAVTNEEFNDVSAQDTLDAIRALLAHSAISPGLWGTAGGDESALRAVESSRPQYLLLFHDIFRNPFRAAPAIDSVWLAWNDGTVKKLAQSAYEHRSLPDGTLDRDRLAVLADALEEAGCADEEILTHFRGPGPHVRGCRVIDLLPNKA